MTKEKKHELLLLVQQRHQEALLEELSEQTKASVKAKPITIAKPVTEEQIKARAAIKALVKQAKR